MYQCGQEQCWRLVVGEDGEAFSEQMADGCEVRRTGRKRMEKKRNEEE